MPGRGSGARNVGPMTDGSMTAGDWLFGPSNGDLTITTGVAGRAARLGHRLVIAVTAWTAEVSWNDGEPSGVDLTFELDSLQVLEGRGGLKPPSGPEKALARVNAVKSLEVKNFPRGFFRAATVEKTADGYRLVGVLEIHGTSRDRMIDLRVEDRGDDWGLSCTAEVTQSDFGIKPYSLMMGALKVADEVTVSFSGVKTGAD